MRLIKIGRRGNKMDDGIEIYEISDIDYDEIYDEINSFVHENDPNNDYGFDEWDKAYIEEMAELNTSDIYVMYDGDIIVGVMKVDLFDGYIYLSDILISKSYRGKGCGKRFIDEVLDLTENLEMDLNVDVRNRDAIVFYLKIGFEITGYVSKYYENEFGSVYMVLTKKE